MSITDQINAQVKTLVDEVKNLTETLRKVELDDLRSQATGLVGSARAEVQEGYAELVQKGEEFVAQARALKLEDVQKRGEKLLDALRKDAKKNIKEARKAAEDVAEDVQKRAEDIVADAQATVAKVTKKAPTTKEQAKKAPAKT